MFLCRLIKSSTNTVVGKRFLHRAPARFIERGRDGQPSSRQISIIKGEPHECFVLVNPEIGKAFQSAADPPTAISDRHSLVFSHSSREFYSGMTLTSSSLHKILTFMLLEFSPKTPRLQLPHDLPCPSGVAKSPATLFLYGLMHTIALDGTEASEIAEGASTVGPDMQHVLERLKDM